MYLCLFLQNLTTESPQVLEEVKQKLEKESLDIDHMESQVKTGSRLVKEKEKKLRQMSSRVNADVSIHSSINSGSLVACTDSYYIFNSRGSIAFATLICQFLILDCYM